jgi:hypothetical protein
VDAVVTDPPWGVSHKTDYRRFSKGGVPRGGTFFAPIRGDDRPFDPASWLTFPKVCLWGYQAFADRLPCGSLLVWCKRPASKLGKFLSDCEVAWVKGGYGARLFWHKWDGWNRASERGKTLHPTQKPVALMCWCLGMLGLKAGDTVLDPYMGSGPVGVACAQAGIHYIGIELDKGYFAVAKRRIEEARRAAVPA